MVARLPSTNPMRLHANEYVREVERACAERGLRLTPLRADVLRLVAESRHPMKAYDLLALISESKAISAPPTVYRTLDFLVDHGFIHKLGSLNAFTACRHPRRRCTVPFLICDKCHAVAEMEDATIGCLLDEKVRAFGFRPQAQTLEVYGLCARCSAL